MKNLNFLKLFLMLFAAAFIGCSDDGGDDPAPAGGGGGGTTPSMNSYSGSASVGDLVTFSVNKSALTYSVTNETTNQTENGNFTVETDTYFQGIYRVAAAADTFFAVELDDKIIAANFPSGNPNNDVSLGVSSEIDNSGRLNEIAGDYVYVKLGGYLSNNPMEWGITTLTTDSLYVIAVNAGNNGPEDTTISRPIDFVGANNAPTGSVGSWSVNNDRLNVNVEGTPLTGYVYAAGTTAAFILDLGPNMGTVYAYKIDDNFNPNNAVGDYKFIDYSVDGDRGAGNYNIDANGNVKYSWTDGNIANTETNVALNSALQQSNIPNVWYAYNINSDGDNLYIVVAGDAIMHYVFDRNNNFYGWGAGAQL